jgi:hypothetical protein
VRNDLSLRDARQLHILGEIFNLILEHPNLFHTPLAAWFQSSKSGNLAEFEWAPPIVMPLQGDPFL